MTLKIENNSDSVLTFVQMSRTHSLTTEHLTVGYRTNRQDHAVAKALQLTVPVGQLICLLGPNGSGKSTLLRTLAGMQPPLAGDIQLLGHPLATLTASQRATQLAIVLTEPPYANLTVYDLVAMGRYPYTGSLGRLSEDDQRTIVEAMEVTRVQHFADRRVGTLSDGERQKVMIARAVAQDTPLLILDEPTAHLDVPNRTAILRLLQQLAHQHQRAVLLSTHALDLALQMADRLWLLHQGTIRTGVPEDLVLDGTLASVFAHEHENITFDLHAGMFRVTPSGGRTIGLSGPMPGVFWVRRALERVGYTVTDPSPGISSVCVSESSAPLRWTIKQASRSVDGQGIEALLQELSVN